MAVGELCDCCMDELSTIQLTDGLALCPDCFNEKYGVRYE